MVQAGTFREDLFYRLNTISLPVPPLRDRPEDIPLLAAHFLEQAAERYGREPKSLSAEAYHCVLNHLWPGNVRELNNVLEAALVLSAGDEIQADDLRLGRPPSSSNGVTSRTFKEAKQQMVETFERGFIIRALRQHKGNITHAATEIGLRRQQLQQKIRELGLKDW